MKKLTYWAISTVGPFKFWGQLTYGGQVNRGAISTVGPFKFWGQLNIGANSVLRPNEAHSKQYDLYYLNINIYLIYI